VDTVTFVTLNLNHTQWVRKTMLRDCRSRVAGCEQGSRELFPVTRITNCRALLRFPRRSGTMAFDR
jgi:hypothetical protein